MEQTLRGKLTYKVTLMVAATLCSVVCSMVFTLMFGLFDNNVDNTEIFKLISPAFQTVVGGFIGLLAGIKLSHDDEEVTNK